MGSVDFTPLLKDKKVLVGITGGIAAFKAIDLVRELKKNGAQVKVVLTENATQFVAPLTLETLSGNPVARGIFETNGGGTHHISAARWADLAIVAPASANFLAKLTCGLADDLLSTELLAYQGPLLVAPAMNPAMWAHPAVQANVRTLKSRGVELIEPGSGVTACGEEGIGRLPEVSALIEALAKQCIPQPARRLRILVSLGPTRSAIDPVRFLSNRSSGKMGIALCNAAAFAGHEVTAVMGPIDLPAPVFGRALSVETTTEMATAVLKEWPSHDVYIGTAAVLDWEVRSPAQHKLKKDVSPPSLDLVRTKDILAEVVRSKHPGQFVLGFAAETDDVVAYGRKKREAKKCDAIFANDVSVVGEGFGADSGSGWWIGTETRRLDRMSKFLLASKLIAAIEKELQ